MCYLNLSSIFDWLFLGRLCKVNFKYLLLLKSLRETTKYYECSYVVITYDSLEIIQNDGTIGGIMGSVVSGERVEWLEYSRDSIYSHKDNWKDRDVALKVA